MVIEVMGHHAGWLALYSGVAGGGDLILLPEIPYEEKVIADYIMNRAKKKKPYSIVVVAEGILKPAKSTAASHIADIIKNRTGLETRETILGYIQRGGSPSPLDRILATRYGASAVELIAQEKFGVMVAEKDNKIVDIPLSEVGDKLRLVPEDHPLIRKARKMDISFGDK
jgi:6-phosphofructokinase 1